MPWISHDLAYLSPSQAEAAYDQMQAHRQAADESRRRLQSQAEAFRQSCPEILHTWVEPHRRTCLAYLAPDFPATPDADVTRYVARATLEAWETLPQDGETFISISYLFYSLTWGIRSLPRKRCAARLA